MSEKNLDPPSRQAILDTLAEEGAPLSIEQLIERMRFPKGPWWECGDVSLPCNVTVRSWPGARAP